MKIYSCRGLDHNQDQYPFARGGYTIDLACGVLRDCKRNKAISSSQILRHRNPQAALANTVVEDSPTIPDEQALQFAAQRRLVDALIATANEDRQAFQELYTLTSAKLFGICYRVAGNQHMAEDILHDVYLTIWKRAGTWDPARGSPIAWLATIARNRSIDRLRSEQRHALKTVIDIRTIAHSENDAEKQLLAAEDNRNLHLCLVALEPKQRAAIETAFFHGATYAEMAQQQGVPLPTMKSRVKRGLIRLAKRMHQLEI